MKVFELTPSLAGWSFFTASADRRDPGRDQRKRPIEVERHLAQRGQPMTFLRRRKVFSRLDRGHGIGEGGVADQRSRHLRGVVHHVHLGCTTSFLLMDWDDVLGR